MLASQRYGRGLLLALPVQDTWIWQMHAEVPLEDQTHETLWRQLLRWLVNEVPDPLTVTASAEPAALNQTVQLKADLRDKTYTRVGDAAVSATIECPTGDVTEVPMRWTSVTDGEYAASFVPQTSGLHRIEVIAERGGEVLARTSLSVDAVDDEGEYFNAQMRAPLLRRMAEETGGANYALDEMDRLANGHSVLGKRDHPGRKLRFVGHAHPLPADRRSRRRGVGIQAHERFAVKTIIKSIKFILAFDKLVGKTIARALFFVLLTATTAAAQANLLIVSGLGGEPDTSSLSWPGGRYGPSRRESVRGATRQHYLPRRGPFAKPDHLRPVDEGSDRAGFAGDVPAGGTRLEDHDRADRPRRRRPAGITNQPSRTRSDGRGVQQDARDFPDPADCGREHLKREW